MRLATTSRLPFLVAAWSLFALGCPEPKSGQGEGSTGSSSTTEGASRTAASAPITTGVSTTRDASGTTMGSSADSDDSAGTGTGCCEAHRGPGCNEPIVQECVCRQTAACCAFDWDQTCADIAVNSCEATCMGEATTAVSGATTGSSMTATASSTTDTTDSTTATTGVEPRQWTEGGTCCQPQPDSPGCSVQSIEDCVCAFDDYCCNTEWDGQCAQEAAEDCQAACGDCCNDHGWPGCGQPDVVECVCAFDDYCCNEAWDNQCVEEAQSDCRLAC